MLLAKKLSKKSICISLFFLNFINCNLVDVEQPKDHSLFTNSLIPEAIFGEAENKTAMYIGFTAIPSGKTGETINDSIYYTGDTLVLELLSSDSTHVKIREFVSSKAGLHTGHQCTYSLTFRNDSLIPDNGFDSSLLTFPRLFTQFISPKSNLPTIKMESIFLLPNDSLNLNFGQIQSIQIKNVLYPVVYGFFNLRELRVDGCGLYVLYLPSKGILRIFTYGLMFPSGTGWDLIES